MGDEPVVTVQHDRGLMVAAVSGDIDLSTVAGLRDRLLELADAGEPLILDLDQVTFMDSAGLGALVAVARRAAAHGTTLHAVCSRPQTTKLLWMVGLDRRIPLSDTLDAALALVAAAPGAPG
jgi:anti-sigma B factor antagonist